MLMEGRQGHSLLGNLNLFQLTLHSEDPEELSILANTLGPQFHGQMCV